jgi:hypothetical protein
MGFEDDLLDGYHQRYGHTCGLQAGRVWTGGPNMLSSLWNSF